MPANNVKPAERINFGKIKKATEYPDLLDIQVQSFKDFFSAGNNPGG